MRISVSKGQDIDQKRRTNLLSSKTKTERLKISVSLNGSSSLSISNINNGKNSSSVKKSVYDSAQDPFNFDADPDPGSALEKN